MPQRIMPVENKFKSLAIREVLEEVLQRDLSKISHKKILEIGCGKWNYAKKILEKNGDKWIGVEPVDFGKENITIIKGSVNKLPFHNNSFDLVLCNQTMEHWFEYGVTFKSALGEISRVLKPNGILMVNVPIFVHGHPYFVRGDSNCIGKIFDDDKWNITLFEKCIPKIEHKGWQRIGTSSFLNRFGYPSFLIPFPNNANSYILNIHLQKINIPHFIPKKDRFRSVKVILRFVKELFLYYF